MVHAHKVSTVFPEMIFTELKCSAILCADLLYQISPKSEKKCRRYGQKLIYTPKLDMSLTAPILTELNIIKKCFVHISSTKLVSQSVRQIM